MGVPFTSVPVWAFQPPSNPCSGGFQPTTNPPANPRSNPMPTYVPSNPHTPIGLEGRPLGVRPPTLAGNASHYPNYRRYRSGSLPSGRVAGNAEPRCIALYKNFEMENPTFHTIPAIAVRPKPWKS